jgi:hypothetical protein
MSSVIRYTLCTFSGTKVGGSGSRIIAAMI